MELKLHNMQYMVNRKLACHAVVTARMTCKLPIMRIRLREFRDQLGLTLEEMSERINASDSQLSRWEKGESNIPSKRLPELAKAYQCRIGDIFADDGDPSGLEITLGQLTEMVRLAQSELEAGTIYADWPQAVATSLHEQLRQIQAAGGIRVSKGGALPSGKVGLSRPASTQVERA